DKEIDKLMALISLSFKKIYKPTNNNLRTSSNTSRANQDNFPTINRSTGECQKPKRVKDAAYHRKKMLLCKQEEAGIQLNAKQVDWRDDTDDESDDQEWEAHYINDQIAPILGYGDLVQGAVTIKWVYYVEGLNHNLFSVGQFCDADLEVAFRKSTCYIRDLKGNNLLICSRGTDLYSITLQDTNSPNPICLMAKKDIVVGLPKLKFIKDHLCSSCELGKAKRKSFHTKITPSSKRKLQLLHMDLCGPMRVASINGKQCVLVIVDDYFRYTWTYFLRSKDETPEVLTDFLRLVQRGLQAQVRIVRTDKGTEFLNQTLYAYFAAEGIFHQTSVARTPEQNSVVERRNRTFVEAARTMLSADKVPLFFWVEAIATACFTQNRSLIIPRHEKTLYHIINERKPLVKFFHIFGFVCYIVRDGENLDKMKEKGDECIFVGYSTQSRAYRFFNKRTRVIMESIHVNFDELTQMASVHNSSDPAPTCQKMASAHNSSDPAPTCQKMASIQISSDPAPECQTMALEHNSLSPGRKCQENVSHRDKTDSTSNELDLLFSPMFDELLNGSTKVVSKSSAVSAADAPYQLQQPTAPLNNHTTPAPTCQTPTIATSVISSENINQAEPHAENDEEELHQFDRLDVWELVDRP
nr:retrovirus-related Pol polyprotein from transposon TNT 1-94 [Tanacetum cinerariifolium]